MSQVEEGSRPATRDRMVVATAELIRAQGYAGTGLNQITDVAAAPKGSMYHHFPGGKQDLAVHALEHYGTTVESLIAHCLDGRTPADGVARFLDALGTQLERSAYRAGCPIGAVAMEVGPANPTLADSTTQQFNRWADQLRAALERAGAQDAADLAMFTVAAIEGALMLARATRSTTPLRLVEQQMRRLLPGDDQDPGRSRVHP